jgi:hypothetical protein
MARPLPDFDGALLQAALRAVQIRRRLSFKVRGTKRPSVEERRAAQFFSLCHFLCVILERRLP